MGNFAAKMTADFCVAFGVVLGSAFMAGIAAVLTVQPPSMYMQTTAEKIKIWAVVAAIGGTIDPFRAIESNFLDGNISPAIKQILHVIIAFTGAHLGTKLIEWICNGGLQH
ncbi:MAG TPA: YtrH family sporulation protein [Bacilli bacterium]